MKRILDLAKEKNTEGYVSYRAYHLEKAKTDLKKLCEESEFEVSEELMEEIEKIKFKPAENPFLCY